MSKKIFVVAEVTKVHSSEFCIRGICESYKIAMDRKETIFKLKNINFNSDNIFIMEYDIEENGAVIETTSEESIKLKNNFYSLSSRLGQLEIDKFASSMKKKKW